MVKCPKCGMEIDFLRHFLSGENSYNYYLDEGVDLYELEEFQHNGQVNDYECPECSEVLFTDGDKARDFLKGRVI